MAPTSGSMLRRCESHKLARNVVNRTRKLKKDGNIYLNLKQNLKSFILCINMWSSTYKKIKRSVLIALCTCYPNRTF